MNSKEYCDYVESRDISHKNLERNFSIRDNESPLVSLKDTGLDLIYEPSIMPAYRYLVRVELVQKIRRINEILLNKDKKLFVRSAWRSFEHQRQLRESSYSSIRKKFPSKESKEINKIVSYYIAPEKKSTHSTGGALDALIYDMKADQILDFGTNQGYKIELSERCYPYHPDISPEAKINRKLLIDLFENEDFVCDWKEYWHFDFGNIGWAIEKKKNHAIFGTIENADDI